MLKSYNELRKIDVIPFCEKRDGLNYLNWAKCKDLLHQNGAEVVYFEPVTNANGSSLFMSDIEFKDSKDNTNRCYEVEVRVVIDELIFNMRVPLLNGGRPVKDSSLTQQFVANAQARAFVKGVAIRTGLGFDLWLKDTEETSKFDNEDEHSLFVIKERVQKKITKLLQKGKSKKEIASYLKLSEANFEKMLGGYEMLASIEKQIENMMV